MSWKSLAAHWQGAGVCLLSTAYPVFFTYPPPPPREQRGESFSFTFPTVTPYFHKPRILISTSPKISKQIMTVSPADLVAEGKEGSTWKIIGISAPLYFECQKLSVRFIFVSSLGFANFHPFRERKVLNRRCQRSSSQGRKRRTMSEFLWDPPERFQNYLLSRTPRSADAQVLSIKRNSVCL